MYLTRHSVLTPRSLSAVATVTVDVAVDQSLAPVVTVASVVTVESVESVATVASVVSVAVSYTHLTLPTKA